MASSYSIKVEPGDEIPELPPAPVGNPAPPAPVPLFIRLLRPFAPQLVSLLVFLALIPIVVSISLFSGWYVWRNVAVGWKTDIYLQYGDGVPPYAEVSLPQLSPNHPYDVSLHLLIPASDANFALGNFMTSLTLATPSNKTLATVRKPCTAIVLPPRRSYLYSSPPPLISLDILLLSSYTPGTSRVNARVEIGRQDEWRKLGGGEGRELSVATAYLEGTVRYQGVRGLVSRFPLVSAILSLAAFFVLSMLVLTACILPTIRWQLSSEGGHLRPSTLPVSTLRKRQVMGNLSVPGKRQRMTYPLESRSQSSVSPSAVVGGTFTDGCLDLQAFKTEDVPINIPPSAHDERPLRRRRSRVTDSLYDSDH
ncbi:putative adipose-regulatory protein-domain-containing protein [Pisolithus marmoratus]|nr:putative adipose-regulatory protein-domain-containing protein [Pisolithus marmoratus]